MPSMPTTIQPPASPGSSVPPKLPVGISDFGELVEERYAFVDKSLLIKKIIDDGAKVTLITRPRRFGKTLNLSILHHFFAAKVRNRPTGDMFKGSAISQDSDCMALQGQYPVIFLTLKGLKESRFETVEAKLRADLARLYLGYPELVDSPHLAPEQKADITAIRSEKASLTELGDSLRNLSEYLYLHHKKPVLMLIDEYDTPIHAADVNGYYQDMANLMRGLLGEALKDNPYLYKAVVTGILRVSRESLFSGLNNLEVYCF